MKRRRDRRADDLDVHAHRTLRDSSCDHIVAAGERRAAGSALRGAARHQGMADDKLVRAGSSAMRDQPARERDAGRRQVARRGLEPGDEQIDAAAGIVECEGLRIDGRASCGSCGQAIPDAV